MINRFQKYIVERSLCNRNNRILLTVSGGIDSMVMLDLFVKTGYEVAVAHCNFQLRGNESDGDEQFVVDACSEYDVPLFVKHFDTKIYARQYKLSVQVAARNLRYAWFEELRKEKRFDYIAVAHHADDQVETFFINLLRGSGLTGLKGISEKRDRIIRPLLFAEREDVLQYARDHQIIWREDSSNKEDKYLRNKIRSQLLPRLKELTDNYQQTVVASLNRLNEADSLLQQLLEEKLSGLMVRKEALMLISLKELLKLKPTETWIYYFIRGFGFNRDTTNGITAAVTDQETGKVFYSLTHQVLVDREYLMIKTSHQEKYEVYLIKENTSEVTMPLHLKLRTAYLDNNFRINPANDFAQLDQDKLKFPLKIRKWKKGDRFKPLGMSGTKLVSDYFIDSKIDRFEKEKIWLLLSGDDIVWVIGHRISDKFKITTKTKKILTISLL